MIPHNERITIIYKDSFSWKEKLSKTFSIGVIADDTLPRW